MTSSVTLLLSEVNTAKVSAFVHNQIFVFYIVANLPVVGNTECKGLKFHHLHPTIVSHSTLV